MKLRLYFIIGCLLGINAVAFPQRFPDIEKLLESNDIESSEAGYEEMVNTLYALTLSPVNINTAGFDIFKQLFLLSDSQIDQILAYRKKQGIFHHFKELLLVYGIGEKDLQNIVPFITLGESTVKGDLPVGSHVLAQECIGRIKARLPLQEGFRLYSPHDFTSEKEYEKKRSNRYQGSPAGTMLKYKLMYKNRFQAGITLENDPGETYFSRNQKTGFDFLSAHLSYTTERWMRRVHLGDYQLQWGQGLLIWGGFSSGKSAFTDGNERAGRGIIPYSSTDENRFLRGIAFAFSPCRQLSGDIFFSYKRTDGTLSAEQVNGKAVQNSSLYLSGYHRNALECKKKHTTDELTSGMALKWNTDYFRVGFNVLYYHFTPALKVGEATYRKYDEDGKHRLLFSVDYKTGFRRFYFYGETAMSDQKAVATLDAIRVNGSFMSASLIYRRYDKRYVSHYASGFGEYSHTSNEEGIYFGLDLSPWKNVRIHLYYDWFHFFSPRYRATHPDYGQEILGEITYRHKAFEHGLRIKYEEKPEDLAGGKFAVRMKSDYRYQCNYTITSRWSVRTRIHMSCYHKADRREQGYLLYQDVIYADQNARLKMQYRLCWFHTDSYESRIYAYENNVLYGYSFPSFMEKGWRTYLNLSWKPVSWITCYLKAGFTVYPGKKELSSGLNRTDGNKLYDVVAQLRIRI